MQQLVSVGSSFGESNYHLQFTPKYRRDVFRDEAVKDLCRRSFEEVCAKMRIGWSHASSDRTTPMFLWQTARTTAYRR